MGNQEGEGGRPPREEEMDLLYSVTTYGLWLVINPVSQILLNIKCQRISVDPESGVISIRGNDSDPSRTLFLKDHGKTWFRTRKEAIRYCNRFKQGDIL